MQLSGEKDTIAAIATPPGQGGIGVVRISGPKAKQVLAKVWEGKTTVQEFESHKLYHGPVGSGGALVDRVLVSWMKAPRSYTGEDVVEISGHGGPVVMKRILEACCDGGARLAQPGEFTKRAFLNGRVDLIQAEAVADIISASDEAGAKSAQDHLAGKLSKAIDEINGKLSELRAFVEASIDFPEEDIELIENARIKERLKTIIDGARKLSATFDEGRLLRDGVKAVIAGKPNAGKSSLFNALVGSVRAIVHQEPGTTRDVVEQAVNIGGRTFHLRDTAGLCDAECEVESIGIDRAKEEMEQADIVIRVIDATTPEVFRGCSENTIAVYNKSDLIDADESDETKLMVSAVKGGGLEKLKKRLLEAVGAVGALEEGGVVVTNIRHRKALEDSIAAMRDARIATEKNEPVECIAQHLRSAQDFLGSITGETFDESVLDMIFTRFCIGK
jgi:tRNA modification GTPase